MGSANLVSKIAAGGLSAGIFLIWWPGHVDGDGLDQIIVRGVLWALVSEVLLLAFAPLETLVVRAVKSRLSRSQERIRARLDATPRPARTGGVVAMASIGLVVPLLMLADPGDVRSDPAPEPPKVIKQVVVKRPVIKREVIVKPEVVAPAPAPSATPAPKTRTIVKRVVVEREKVVEKKVPQATETATTPTKAAPAETTPAPAAEPAATSARP